MVPSTDLLSRIAGRGLEDTSTEILAAILAEPGTCRRFLEDVVGIDPGDPSASVTVETQRGNIHAAGRPDLALRGETFEVLVEAKVDALLTDNQPTAYVAELQARRQRNGTIDAVLVFVVPERRRSAIAWELRQRLDVAPELGQVHFCRGDVRVRVMTWREVACAIQRAPPTTDALAWLVSGFRQLVERRLSPAITEMSMEYLTMLKNPAAVSAVAALADLLDELRIHAVEEGDEVERVIHENCSGGFSTWPKGQRDLGVWVGYLHRATANTGLAARVPVWLHLASSAFRGDARERIAAGGYRIENGADHPRWECDHYLVPVFLSDVESGGSREMLRHIMNEIRRVRSLAVGAGPL